MKRIFLFSVITFLVFSGCCKPAFITKQSSYNVRETSNRLDSLISGKGLSLFSRIDHSFLANEAGMGLRPTEVLLFGNPKIGTELMYCNQKVAIDLPLKILVWENENKITYVGYFSPESLARKHRIKGCREVISKMGKVMESLTNEAAR